MLRPFVVLSSTIVFITLAACVTSISERLPFGQMPEIIVGSPVSLTASPAHPAAYLSTETIDAGERVHFIGIDESAAWLLVMHDDLLGWMPSIFSRTNAATLEPAIQVESLDNECSRYLGATFSLDDRWASVGDGRVTVLGSIHRPESSAAFESAALQLEIEGNGAVTESDFVHTPLTDSSALVLFAFAVDGLSRQSRIGFSASETAGEALAFQAAFFSDECADTAEVAQLPIGGWKTVASVAEDDTPPTPTSTPKQTATSTTTPIVRTDGATVTPTPAPTNTPIVSAGAISKWEIRAHNMDEYAWIYINDDHFMFTLKQRDSGWTDFTDKINPGQENIIRLVTWNVDEEFTWGYAIKGDGDVLWEDQEGEVGFRGANNHDKSKENRVVYYRAFLIDEHGGFSEIPGSNTKWSVRLAAVDDTASVFVNDGPYVSVRFADGPGDSGWVDISDWIHDGHENKIEFSSRNTAWDGSYDLSLRRGNTVVWSKQGQTSERDLVYDQILYVTRDGDISSIPEKDRWYVKIGDADDNSAIYLNDELILERNFEDADHTWIEITDKILPHQENILRFSTWNGPWDGSWHFSLMHNNGVIWEASGSSERREQQIYDYVLFIQHDGEVTSDSETPRWYIRADEIDDLGTMFVDGRKLVEIPVGQSSGWTDITEYVTPGKEHKLRFTNWNGPWDASWRFLIRRNNTVVWEEAGESDQREQIVFDETVTISPDGEFLGP